MTVCTLQRREEIQKHNVKEDNTILLQFRSRDEEAAVSSSDRRSKGARADLVVSDYSILTVPMRQERHTVFGEGG